MAGRNASLKLPLREGQVPMTAALNVHRRGQADAGPIVQIASKQPALDSGALVASVRASAGCYRRPMKAADRAFDVEHPATFARAVRHVAWGERVKCDHARPHLVFQSQSC